MTDSLVPPALIKVVAELWRLTPPGPDNLFTARAFKHLCEACEQLYPPVQSKDALGIALHNALRALGLGTPLPICAVFSAACHRGRRFLASMGLLEADSSR